MAGVIKEGSAECPHRKLISTGVLDARWKDAGGGEEAVRGGGEAREKGQAWEELVHSLEGVPRFPDEAGISHESIRARDERRSEPRGNRPTTSRKRPDNSLRLEQRSAGTP